MWSTWGLQTLPGNRGWEGELTVRGGGGGVQSANTARRIQVRAHKGTSAEEGKMVMLQVSWNQSRNRGSTEAIYPDPHLRLSNQNLQGWPQSGIVYCPHSPTTQGQPYRSPCQSHLRTGASELGTRALLEQYAFPAPSNNRDLVDCANKFQKALLTWSKSRCLEFHEDREALLDAEHKLSISAITSCSVLSGDP